MSEFNVGDLVIVTLDAIVRAVLNNGVLEVQVGDAEWNNVIPNVPEVQIEKRKPALPTTNGSVIKTEEPYGYFVLTTDLDGNPSWGNSDFAFDPEHIRRFEYEVILDLGILK